MMHGSYNKRGFTLIEALIYLALFALIIGGAVTAAYAMFESASRNQTKAMLSEEGSYLIGKVDWALTGAYAASVPLPTQLSVNRTGIGASDLPLFFNLSGGKLLLSRGSQSAETLNNSNVTVNSTVFTHVTGTGDGVTPESVSATITVSARTPTGMVVSEDFSTVKYFRK